MPSYAESFLKSAKTGRGQVNMLAVVVAFVLSIMVVHTHNQCLQIKDPKQFKEDSGVKLMNVLAIIVIVACVLLFSYDIYVMVNP